MLSSQPDKPICMTAKNDGQKKKAQINVVKRIQKLNENFTLHHIAEGANEIRKM
jgi:hypothetical protein